jgi:hypothetical protein
MTNLIEHIKHIPDGTSLLKDWVGNDGQVVDQETAQKRADICLKCPMNQSGSILTQSVASAIKRYLEFKSQIGLRVKGEKSLRHCSVCGCVNRLQIWCPDKFFSSHTTREELEKYHQDCWKKAIPTNP